MCTTIAQTINHTAPKKQFRLIPLLLNLSNHKEWNAAKKEWKVSHVEMAEIEKQCLCGHPIKEVVHIHNQENHKATTVGNCCIKLILEELDHSHIFTDVKRLFPTNKPAKHTRSYNWVNKTSLDKKLKPKTLEYALSRNIITQLMFDVYYEGGEQGFIMSIVRRYINYLILKAIRHDNTVTIEKDVINGVDIMELDILRSDNNGLTKTFLNAIDFRNKKYNKWYRQATNKKAEYLYEYYTKDTPKAVPLTEAQKDFVIYYTLLGVTMLLNELQDEDQTHYDFDLVEIFKLKNPLPKELL